MVGRACAVVAALGLIGIVVVLGLGSPAADAAGGAAPVTVKVEDEAPVDFSFGVAPKRLPTGEGGVTRLMLDLEETSFQFGARPGLQMVTIGMDRSITMEPRGLPVCHRLGAEAGPRVAPVRFHACAGAVVGRVGGDVFLDYPEQNQVLVHGAGTIYRSVGKSLLLEIPLGVFNETVWLVADVRPSRRGKIGSEMTIQVPTINEGLGTLTRLDLNLGRTFARDGERIGYVEAGCHDGRLTASQSTRLTDGTADRSESLRACAVAR
jgi:hypothetical protein